MNLLQALTGRREPVRSDGGYFNYQGHTYGYGSLGSGIIMSGNPNRETIGTDFVGLAREAYGRNGVIFACMLVRMLVFAEARFQFRQIVKGRPGNLFGSPSLLPLEKPWNTGTTGDLLTRAIQDADLSGNFFGLRTDEGVRRLRPDWVSIVVGADGVDADAAEAEIAGYIYTPGGLHSGKKPVSYAASDVAHFAPVPDPLSWWRGMSWLTPVVREISADSAATSHKLKFFENGATLSTIIRFPDMPPETFKEYVTLFRGQQEGVSNAYRTLAIGGGADVSVVGANMQQLDFKVTQGAGETRIAAAAGVPPVIVGLSEGLQGSSLNEGNYAMARRRFADGTMRPLWRNIAGSLAAIIDVPKGAELWYDDRDIPFLQEDVKDAAEIVQIQSTSIRTLADGGFKPETVVDAITSGDLTRLVHTGLPSVQQQAQEPSDE